MTSRKPSQPNRWPAGRTFRDQLQREAGRQLHMKKTQRVAAPDLDAWLARLETAEPRQLGELELIPLCLNEIGPASQVVLSNAAIEAGWLQIGEQGEGVVQEVVAFNRGRDPVLILEGDTLIGCKQNRVVAHSVIVAPASTVVIPVGCMEQGRWAHSSQLFQSGDLRMESRRHWRQK